MLCSTGTVRRCAYGTSGFLEWYCRALAHTRNNMALLATDSAVIADQL
jgi:hypothetical protein